MWWLEVKVVLDVCIVKVCVDESFDWVLLCVMKGIDIYGVIIGI